MIFKELNTFGEFGRSGVLKTRVGEVKTPTFMPDGTRGAVKSLTPEQVVDTGVGIVLANTYHLHLQPGEKLIKKLGGLHKFTNRKGPILTDSGGFQIFSLDKHVKITEEGVEYKDPVTGTKHFITPEKSIQIQLDLGADMIVAFDHLVGLKGDNHKEVKEAFDRTHRWLDRCIKEFKRLTADMIGPEDPEWFLPLDLNDRAKIFNNMANSNAQGRTLSKGLARRRPLLFGVVQGGLDLDLRKKSLDIVQSSDVDGIAIGGLSVGETREEMTEVLKALAPLYIKDKPRFLLGVGTPEDLKIAVENGIDMLDCVLPTRNARHGSIWTREPCDCTAKSEQVRLSRSTSQAISAKNKVQSSRTVPNVRLAQTDHDFDETSSEHKTSGSNSDLVCKFCKTERLSTKINLTNEKFKDDAGVIEEGCDCYTCEQGFSRAFLRQMFKSKDPLAGTLASIHNLRHMMRICESYQNGKIKK